MLKLAKKPCFLNKCILTLDLVSIQKKIETNFMNVEIGKKIAQTAGFSALILNPFPSKGLLNVPVDILLKAGEAEKWVGKLDGVTYTLPDVDFFLKMFITKDATASSQIEGTRATLIDALEREAKVASKPTDAADILYYIKALNYGLKRVKDLPLSLRLIREIHKKLMMGARSTHFSNPGEFRSSQNYIGGTGPGNALFVPPPVPEMKQALYDFENFLHEKNKRLPLIHIGLMHAQFEAIHPFLDGNGRTGRLLISLLFCQKKLLERPVLFLSSWLKKHQQLYYQTLEGYHNGQVENWIKFFLDTVIETSKASISILKQIRELRDQDMEQIQSLAKRESESGVKTLSRLFRSPIVAAKDIMSWTGFTRAGAQKVIRRFIALGILKPLYKENVYGQAYIYSRYLDIFKD